MYGVIYLIKNNINGKMYFGQTIESFQRRYGFNLQKYSHNTHLKNAIEKYGIDNFTIIEKFDEAESKEELDSLEDMYICLYNTIDSQYGYNKKRGGANGKPSNETRQKLSEKLKGTQVGELNNMYGKKHSQESKQRMSENHADFTGENNGRARKVVCVTTGEVFECMEYAKEQHPSANNIPLNCKYEITFSGRDEVTKQPLQWMYYEEWVAGGLPPTIEDKYRPVLCITTNEHFENAVEASRTYKMKSATGIKDCCNGKRKTAGKHPVTNAKLEWSRVSFVEPLLH